MRRKLARSPIERHDILGRVELVDQLPEEVMKIDFTGADLGRNRGVTPYRDLAFVRVDAEMERPRTVGVSAHHVDGGRTRAGGL